MGLFDCCVWFKTVSTQACCFKRCVKVKVSSTTEATSKMLSYQEQHAVIIRVRQVRQFFVKFCIRHESLF